MKDKSVRRRMFLASAGAVAGTALAGCGSPSEDGTTMSGDGDTQTTEEPAESPKEQVDQLDRYPRVKVGSVDDLSAGDVETFAYPLDGTNNFLTRMGEEAWGGVGPSSAIVAFSNLCTHMGCGLDGNVKPDQEMAGPCPCHYTTFDLSKGGLVVAGAATTDLPQVQLEVDGGDIYATGMNGLAYGRRNNLRDGEPVAEAE